VIVSLRFDSRSTLLARTQIDFGNLMLHGRA